MTRYQEPHRCYHGLFHIEHCFNELIPALYLAHDPDAVKMFIPFHDAVCNLADRDNEKKSARLFLEISNRYGLPHIFTCRVLNLIRASEHKVYPAVDFDSRLVCDIDLSIWGQPENVFDEYDRQIRQEYCNVEESAWNEKRPAFLNSFLKRWTIYQARYFFEKYEAQAQRNLRRTIAKYQSKTHS